MWDDDPIELSVFVVSYANSDQGNHSPNEHLDPDCFEHDIRTTSAFLDQFVDADM